MWGWVLLACVAAALAGFAGAWYAALARERAARRARARAQAQMDAPSRMHGSGDALADLLVGLACKGPAPAGRARRGALRLRLGEERLLRQARLAGLARDVDAASLGRARMRASAFLACAFALGGGAASMSAAVLGGVLGAACGWLSLPWALRRRAQARTAGLEAGLSESIEVMCLGLRSGLSFDRALGLYCRYFTTTLAKELQRAQMSWSYGLASREDALRGVAEGYDSQMLSRVVDGIVRSMRFGSPLADDLEVLAGEARRAREAQVRERVMKAPVKMMLPVGLLILPSMLLLVLGPILLDLMQGF